MGRIARPLLALVAALWVALLLAAPTAALGVPASGSTYAFGSLICHQRPDRSFHLGAAQLPVCARCFGLYVGAAVGAVLALAGWPGATGGRLMTRPALRAMLVVAAIPTAMTWGSEVAGLWSPVNVTRFLAALPLGAAVAVTVNYVGCAQRQRTGSRAPRTPI